MSFTAARSRPLILSLLACVVAALGGLLGATAASAGGTTLPTPTTLAITSISSIDTTGVPSGAAPSTLVEAGGLLTIHVEFTSGGLPAAFSSDTTLKITSTAGTLTATTGIAPGGKSFADIPTSITTAVNNVGLTLTVAKGPFKGLTTGPLADILHFDVLTKVKSSGTTPSDAFTNAIGGDDTSCGNATKSSPVCAIVVLPSGALSTVFLSTGLCDAAYLCDSGGALVQTLFESVRADGTSLYGPTNPATLIIKCDKLFCGTGQIQKIPVHFSLAGNGALDQTAGPCPAKGVAIDALHPCIDYVQSKRDGSGDTHLYLLFTQDLRGGIG